MVQVSAQKSTKRNAHLATYEELVNLNENGILVIRIEDYHKAIIKLEDLGKISQAEIQKDIADKNKTELISAFDQNYTFSKYTFYHAKDADKLIKEGDFSVTFGGNADLNNADLINVYLTQYNRLHYTGMSNGKAFYFYKIFNNNIHEIGHKFPQGKRKPFFKRLFSPDTYDEKVKFINGYLNDYKNKLASKLLK